MSRDNSLKDIEKKEGDAFKGLVEIDRVIHEPARFLIMGFLYVVDCADFIFLMNRTELTRGNLSAHLTKLETAGYLHVHKEFVNKMPRTVLSLTPSGRTAFDSYRQRMKQAMERLPE